MNCYIRNKLIFSPNQKKWDSEKYSIEAIVNNYPKHERAGVYVKEDGKEKRIGEVSRIYIIDDYIFGDIEFFRDWKDVICRLRKNPYSEAELRSIGDNPDFSCLDKLIFVDNEYYTDPIDLKSIIGEQEYAYWMANRPRYDNVKKYILPKPATAHKKECNEKTNGFTGQASDSSKQGCDAVRVISRFAGAINNRCRDKRAINLIERIISVVGASENCRQDEIEAAYDMSLEDLIDSLVRDWYEASQL